MNLFTVNIKVDPTPWSLHQDMSNSVIPTKKIGFDRKSSRYVAEIA